MNTIKFIDFTFDESQTILKYGRSIFHINSWENEVNRKIFLNNLKKNMNINFRVFEVFNQGFKSPISKNMIREAFNFKDNNESVKELLFGTPKEIWICIDVEEYENISYADKTKYANIFKNIYWGSFKYDKTIIKDTIFENRNNFVEKYNIKKVCQKYKCLTFFENLFERIRNEGVSIDHNEFYDTDYSIIGINSHYCDEEDKQVWINYGFKLIEPLYDENQSTFMYQYFYKSLSEQKQIQDYEDFRKELNRIKEK